MGLFKKIIKGVSSLIPGGGVIQSIIGPDRSPQQVKDGLALLDPIAQYNRTMARPRIAIAIVFTYLGGIIIQWIQKLCGVAQADLITIPEKLVGFATVVVSVIVGSRGIEKIMGKIFKKRKEKNA